VLPEGVNPYDVKSNLMPDGFLRVEAPVGGRQKPVSNSEEQRLNPDQINKQYEPASTKTEPSTST